MSYNTILATAPLTTQNYHLKMIGTSIGNSLIWDNGTNVGIGNTNTSYTLDVSGTGRFLIPSTTSGGVLHIGNVGNGTFGGLAITDGGTYPLKIWGSELQFLTGSSTFGSASTKLTIASSGAATFINSLEAGKSGSLTVGDLFVDNPNKTVYVGRQSATGGDNSIFIVRNRLNSPYFYIDPSNDLAYFNNCSVGIGTAAPATQVEIYNSTTLSGFRFGTATATESQMTLLANLGSGYDNAGYIKAGQQSATNSYLAFGNKTSGTLSEKLRITSAGNVGIGTTSPTSILHLNSTADTTLTIDSGGTAFTSTISFVADSERAKIIGSYASGGGGQLAFHTDSAGGSDVQRLLISNTGAATFSNLGTGTVTATSGTLSTVSDMNLKDEDGYIDNALEKVLKLKPRYFHWKEESGLPTDLRQLGFYAQEVNEALGEEAANTPKTENDKWGIYDRGMIAFLTAAIQEQQAQIEELKKIVATK